MLKIHAELYEIGPYFPLKYKGLVLAIILFATFEMVACLTLNQRVKHLAPSLLLCHWRREDICKTRLVHGSHFRKIAMGLNESLKPAPKLLLPIRVISFYCTFAQ